MTHKIDLIPITYKNEIQCHDIYVDGEWYGSRRTIEQCKESVNFILNGDAQAKEVTAPKKVRST